jgi:hypothetical protein
MMLNYRLTVRKGEEIRTCENVAVFVVNVACDEECEECEQEIPEPVGSGR